MQQTQTSVDLSNCDREPIHLLGKVQSFGFLLAVTADWLISNVSANLDQFVKATPEALLGAPLTTLLAEDTLHTLRNRLQHQASGSMPEVLANVDVTGSVAPGQFDVSLHLSGRKVILEFEPSKSRDEADRHVSAVQQAIQRISDMKDVDATLKFSARFCAALTGFDRVMTYVFHSDDTGEVRAEWHANGMEPFLGLRYPASDIPKQARALYVRNTVRTIDDSASDGAPILPLMGNPEDQLDLSNSVLRSVSPIHLEYLRNMGVAASMSISIIVEGKLWGLIACHHREPKYLPQAQRNAMVLFGQMLSLILGAKIAAEDTAYKNAAADLINSFSRSATSSGDIATVVMDQRDTVLDMMSAEGVAVVTNGAIHLAGATPSKDEVTLLARRLNAQPPKEIFSTHELSSFLPSAADFVARAAGMLSIPISKTPRDYIMFFRPEVVRRVNWAGNPEKPVSLGPNGVRLTPRKSFEAWQTLQEGQSEEWSRGQIAAAEQFRITVLEVVLRLADEAASDRKRSAEKQELLIAELNHRVRNILGLVRGIISQTSKGQLSVEAFAGALESRVRALARAHDQITKQNWSSASFKTLIRLESEAYLSDKSDRIALVGPDIELLPVAYSAVALVMHEMITNSAKYGSLSDQRGSLTITIEPAADGSVNVLWQEADGPLVKPPTRRGFGSTITERSIAFELNGESEITYELAGVRARFWLPALHVSRIVQPSEAADPMTPSAQMPSVAPVEGVPFPAEVLVVEDNMIIAMDTETMLIKLGAKGVRVCPDVSSSLTAIDTARPDFAILDINLGVETSLDVARRLTQLGVPFIFASGYGDAQPLKEFQSSTDVITKPYNEDVLRKAALMSVQ